MYLTNKYGLALTLKSLYLQLAQTWRIFTSTPWHKRKRLSLFVLGVWVLTIFNPKRAMILRACYLWFRYVDDVADQELLNPLPTLEDFVESKKKFLVNLLRQPYEDVKCDNVDFLMLYTHVRCLELFFNVVPSMMKILEAVSYDVVRSQVGDVPSRVAIAQYFEKLDLPTVLETLRIMGEKSVQPEDLQGFMDATRIYFNLRDFVHDMEMGILNIPQEEVREFGIDMDVCDGKNLKDLMAYMPFQSWFSGQLTNMTICLQKGLDRLASKKAMLVTRVMLYIGFVKPCMNFAKRWEGA